MQKNSINSTVLLLSQISAKFWGEQFSRAWECLDLHQIQRHSKVTGNQESGSPGTRDLGRHQGHSALPSPGQVLSVPTSKQGTVASKEHTFRACSGAGRVNFHRFSRTGHFSRLSLNATKQAGQAQSSFKFRVQKQSRNPHC